MTTQMIIGILIPFAGTTLGAAMVFLLKDRVSNKLQRILTGFAAGVMVAASFWSLLNPALESSESMGKLSFIPAAVGFLIGIGFLLLLDVITPHTAGALALAIGIAIQNFPEGAIVSMPLRAEGMSKGKTFLYGALSGAVEPIAAVVTIFAFSLVTSLLPYMLAFAAGAMIYVVVEELIPEMSEGEHSNWGTIAFSIGFVLMMILDVALG